MIQTIVIGAATTVITLALTVIIFIGLLRWERRRRRGTHTG